MLSDDEIVDTNKLSMPTIFGMKIFQEKVEKYFSLIFGIIKSNINTSETITISERYFPNKEVFGCVMIKIGEAFADNEDIEICYQKPEDKNPSSPTFGEIFCKFVVNNLALITANKIIKDEHKMAMKSISKDIKTNIVETVKKKYEKKEENG